MWWSCFRMFQALATSRTQLLGDAAPHAPCCSAAPRHFVTVATALRAKCTAFEVQIVVLWQWNTLWIFVGMENFTWCWANLFLSLYLVSWEMQKAQLYSYIYGISPGDPFSLGVGLLLSLANLSVIEGHFLGSSLLLVHFFWSMLLTRGVHSVGVMRGSSATGRDVHISICLCFLFVETSFSSFFSVFFQSENRFCICAFCRGR